MIITTLHLKRSTQGETGMAEQNAQAQQLQQQAQTLDAAHRIIGQLYQQLVETTTLAQQLQRQVNQLTQAQAQITPPVVDQGQQVVPSFQSRPVEGSNNPATVSEELVTNGPS